MDQTADSGAMHAQTDGSTDPISGVGTLDAAPDMAGVMTLSAAQIAAGSMTASQRSGLDAPAAPPAEIGTLAAFIAARLALISCVSILVGLSGFALTLPGEWLGNYLRNGLLALTVIVWLELLNQLPRELALFRLERIPPGTNWRFIAFAYLVQLMLIAFVIFALQTYGSALLPLVAALAGLFTVSVLARRMPGLLAVICGFLIFEGVMLLVSPGYDGLLGRLLSLLGQR
jgi:hypothetical protein